MVCALASRSVRFSFTQRSTRLPVPSGSSSPTTFCIFLSVSGILLDRNVFGKTLTQKFVVTSVPVLLRTNATGIVSAATFQGKGNSENRWLLLSGSPGIGKEPAE